MSLGGYPLHSPSPYRLWFRVGFDFGVKDPSQGNGLDCQCLLHEAEEEFAATFGFPPIKSKRKLVQVVIEMLMTDRPLVGSHQPPFEEGDNAVDPRHQLRGSFLFAS